MGRLRWVALIAVGVVLVGCRIESRVDVDVARNGSGTVTVSVGLDGQAAQQLGDPKTALATSDLVAAGWTVAPASTSGGTTWLRASKRFVSPDDFTRVMAEIGLTRSWRLQVDNQFARIRWRVSGRIVSDGSIDQFSDSKLKAALDGLPLGLTPAAEAADLKASGPIPLTLSVHLPDGPEGGYQATVDVVGGGSVDRSISTSSSHTDHRPVRWFAIAGGLVLVGLVLAVVGRRRANRPIGRHARQ